MMSSACSMSRQLRQCPKCHQDYDTDEHGKRYPTSCRWCSYTICCTCCQEAPKPKNAKIYGVPCMKCGKGGAFHMTAPVVHDFSCQLLAKIQLLENQLQQQQLQQQSPPSSTTMDELAMHPSRFQSVSDSEEPPQPTSEEEKQSPVFLSSIHPVGDEEAFPDGTEVYDGRRWGTIESSTKKGTVYAIQYGDGDPEWVEYEEMIELVLAADVKLNNGSKPLFSGDPSDEEDFLGRPVFREFSDMGWYWGKVVKCSTERQYTVVFAGGKKTGFSFGQDKVRQWVDAAQRFKECNTPAKRKAIQYQHPVSTPQRKKPKTINQKYSPEPYDDDEVTVEDDFKLPASARAAGWSGFERHISESNLPTKFRHILRLIDFLFPVSKGEDTFYYALWERSTERGFKGGAELREVLKRRKRKDESVLSWHKKATPYVPESKRDLADFIELLMDLEMSPKVMSKRGRYDTSSSSSSNPRQRSDLILSDSVTLPSSFQGTGWRGFNKAISADTLPQNFRQVFEIMDFFFPVAAGEKSFLMSLFDCSSAQTIRPGDSIRKILQHMKKQDPNLPGLRWHSCNTPYVPPTKKDLADFLRVLMSVPKAPVLAA